MENGSLSQNARILSLYKELTFPDYGILHKNSVPFLVDSCVLAVYNARNMPIFLTKRHFHPLCGNHGGSHRLT